MKAPRRGHVLLGVAAWVASLPALAALVACAPGGLAGENGALVLGASVEHPFGVATGGSVRATLSDASFGVVSDPTRLRVVVDDPSVLSVSGSGRDVTLSGIQDGVTALRVFEGERLVDRFRILVAAPTDLSLLVPAGTHMALLRATETAPGFVLGTVVMTDIDGRVVLDDALTVTADGEGGASATTVVFESAEGERHVLAARAGSVSLEATLEGTSGAIDAIARVGTSHAVVGAARGDHEVCFVGTREGHVVLNAAITIAATAPQSVVLGPGAIACATPSGPGVLHVTAPGLDGAVVALDVSVGP